MTTNPVFCEGIQVHFIEGHGFVAYFYVLVILAPVEFLALFIPSLDAQMWTGSANLFKVTSVTALLLMVYFALRIANQEFSPWRFVPLKRWLREQAMPVGSVGLAQLALLSLHITCFVLLCAPLLVWAGAIARTQPRIVLSTLLLLVFYSVSYSVWGLATSALWEHRLESLQVFVRCLFFCLVVLSALLYLPLNPVAYLLSHLESQELAPLTIGGWRWSPTVVHFTFHALLLVTGLATYRWALRREAEL
jgi:hypothetical protein